MAEPINLFDPAVRADPYPSYARMRREGPVQRIQPGDFWAVTRADDVEYVLKNPKIFSSSFEALWRPDWLPYSPVADSMLAKDGPAHAQLRGLLSRAFTPRAMARMEPRVRAICVGVAERLAELRECDFVEELCARVPALVIADILGLDRPIVSEFKRWVAHLASVSPIYPGDEAAEAIRASIRELDGYFREIVADRRRERRDDPVSDLIAAEVDGRVLTDEELISFLFVLMPAGFETTAHFFSHALLDFDRRPEVYAGLRADPARIPAYVDELLRFDPPVHGIFRVTTEETELGGVQLPRGAMMMVVLAAANRDPARFADPGRFDAERGSLGGLTFGHGVHHCLGVSLAKLEARITLEELAARFVRFEKLPGEIQWNQALHVRGPVSLPFRAIPAET